MSLLSPGHASMMKLVCEETGNDAAIGELYGSSKGDTYVLTGGRAPHKPGSTGRVYVKDTSGHEHSFYPSVLGLVWVNFHPVINGHNHGDAR